jgi:hypothetical protein
MASGEPARRNVSSLLGELQTSARYVVDPRGRKTDVILSLAVWKGLMAMLEELDDREVVRQWLPRLKLGPKASGALRWQDVSDEWDDDEAIPAANRT